MPTALSSWQRRALVVFLILLFTNNLIWYWLGGNPLHWDSSVHLFESLQAIRVVTTSGIPFREWLYFSWYYPPFVSWIAVPFYLVFGEGLFAASLVMTFFLLLLVGSTYGIGRIAFDENAGLLGALFVGCFPIVLDFSRQFMLDLPLASTVALSLFLLLRSDHFLHRNWSIGLGIALGCGFLTKWTFPFFLLFPLLYSLWQAGRRNLQRRSRSINAVLSLALAAVVSTPWYFVHIVQILAGRSSQLAEGQRTFLQTVLYYVQIIPYEVSWLIVVALVWGILLYARRARPAHLPLILSMFGGYLLLTVVNFKMPRFSIPLLPPLTVLASGAILQWSAENNVARTKRIKGIIAFMVLVILQSFATTYVPPNSSLGKFIGRPFLSVSLIPVLGPERHDWQQQAILGTIATDTVGGENSRKIVRIIPDYQYFNWQSFQYVAALDRLPVVVSGISGFPLLTDYVVLKTGELGEDVIQRQRLTERVLGDSSLFTVMRRFPLPDGSEAILLRVQVHPVANAHPDTITALVTRTADQFVRRYLRPVAGYSIQVGAGTKFDLQRGRVKSLRVRATRAKFGDFAFKPIGVTARNVDLELADVKFDPSELLVHHSLQLLSLRGLIVHGFEVDAADLKEYLIRTSGNKVAIQDLGLDDGVVSLSLRPQKPPMALDVCLQLKLVDHRDVTFHVTNLRIGGLPIAPAVVNLLSSAYNPLFGNLRNVSDVWIGDLTIEKGRLTISDKSPASQAFHP